MVAGASFSKLAEHFSIAMPVRSSGLAQDGFDTVAALGVAGMFVVLVGAGIAAPTLGRFLRMNGWISIHRRVIQAIVFTLITRSDAVAVSFWPTT